MHEDDPAHDAAGMEDLAPAPQGDGPRRAERVRERGTRRLIVLLVTLGLVVVAGTVGTLAFLSLWSSGESSNDYAGDGSGKVSVVVRSGDTSRTIGATLEKAGVVKTARAFGDAAADNPEAASIQPGTYAMRTQMSAASALAMMLNSDNRTVPRVTIREGLWTSEVIAALSAATGQPLADYQVALKDPAALDLPAVAKGRAEGYLFPATYEFETSTTAAEQLHTMVAKSLEELGRLGVTGNETQRVVTIASIVEA
ncbi:MAG: endolytic transglycosylase MltG, partial [Chloroflexota bacterium]|nr:endolytic transglycosylase MltG [Chloroflexota bacterium]